YRFHRLSRAVSPPSSVLANSAAGRFRGAVKKSPRAGCRPFSGWVWLALARPASQLLQLIQCFQGLLGAQLVGLEGAGKFQRRVVVPGGKQLRLIGLAALFLGQGWGAVAARFEPFQLRPG